MNKNIQKAAKKFAAHMKGDISIESIITYLHSKGYSVVFYNDESQHPMMIKYNLVDYSKKVNGFTLCSYEDKFVFIKDGLTDSHKLYTLLHEIAHIILGHLRSDRFLQNDWLDDMEAETFTYTILTYKPKNLILVTVLVIFSIAVIYSSVSIKHSATSEIVYITGSSEKYHRQSCFYTKDKNCTAVLRSEADKNFVPCSLCNP